MPSQNRRSGFTIVELLTVIGLIGLLTALLLPAVQSAREKSRAIQCSNNLRQFGIAFHAFHEQKGFFPPTRRNLRGWPTPDQVPLWLPRSAQFEMLPGLDQAVLYEKIDVTTDMWSGSDPLISSENQVHMESRIPVFCCPSDDVPPGCISYLYCMGTSFSGLATPDWPAPNTMLNGVGIGVRSSRITDGLSNTVAFSERLIGDHNPKDYSPSRDVAYVPYLNGLLPPDLLPDNIVNACSTLVTNGQNHFSFRSTGWLFGHFGITRYNHILGPNSSTPDCSSAGVGTLGTYSAKSFHPGGVFALFADGSVHFVSDSIDLTVWRGMGTYAGAEIGGNL